MYLFRTRPETCMALARRLVTGALGVRLPTQTQERLEEKEKLSIARGQGRSINLNIDSIRSLCIF